MTLFMKFYWKFNISSSQMHQQYPHSLWHFGAG